jgi:enediyne biosynthesis protein E4
VWLAVVSQPCNRGADVPLPGAVDLSLREFWVGNPWQIIKNGHNLSAFERKRAFLNVKGKDFVDISHLTGADNDGDGRAVVAADFRNVGRMDLIVRQAGGGPLLLYENRFPRKHYLKVTLRGSKSNRQGIGARLIAVVKGQQLVREMFPANTFLSQAPNIVHFGLAESKSAESLTIRWPSGKVQVLKDLPGDRHIVVDESKNGADAIEEVIPGRTIAP